MSGSRSTFGFKALLAIGVILAPLQAAAQEQQQDGSSVELDGGEVDGVATANLAAGVANQQANAGMIAVGDVGLALGIVDQVLTTPGDEQTALGSAEIADGAFAGSNGWIAANLVAGSANQQANINLMAIGLKGEVASAALLSQIRGPVTPAAEPDGSASPQETMVRIGDGAFEGASGLVQLSLVAGDRNSTANVFAMTIAEPLN